jgi:hypothetical protein
LRCLCLIAPRSPHLPALSKAKPREGGKDRPQLSAARSLDLPRDSRATICMRETIGFSDLRATIGEWDDRLAYALAGRFYPKTAAHLQKPRVRDRRPAGARRLGGSTRNAQEPDRLWR